MPAWLQGYAVLSPQLPATPPLHRALTDVSNLSPRGGKRPGAGRPSSAERNERAKQARIDGRKQQHRMESERAEMVHQLLSLSNPSGRSLTHCEHRLIIALLLALQAFHHKQLTDAIDTAAQWIGSSSNTIRAVWHAYKNTGKVPEEKVDHRGRRANSESSDRLLLTADVIAALQLHLQSAHTFGLHCSSRTLQNFLHDECEIEVHRSTVRRWLRRIDYRWRRSHCIGIQSKSVRDKRLRIFLREYSEALQSQSRGEAVIVYTDESFIHTGHHWRYGWFALSNEVKRKCNRGKRLILLHAMTKDGLLVKDKSIAASDDVMRVERTAELIFPGLNMNEDYHESMNGEVFAAWVEKRLIPAFKTKYKEKRMALVLDNAPYHHSHPTGYKNPLKMAKGELAAWLTSHWPSDTPIHITRDGMRHTFGKTSLFAAKGSKYAPTVEEMRTLALSVLASKPQLKMTRLQLLFDKQQYTLVWTPPYTPEVQPIELVWAHVKNYVARHTTANTSVDEVQSLVRKGFYGDDGDTHAGVGARLCARLIAHCHRWCNSFIEADSELAGTVDDLQCTETSKSDNTVDEAEISDSDSGSDDDSSDGNDSE